MPPSDESNSLAARNVAVSTLVVIKDGFRVTKLLLHSHDEHEKLDEKLLALLQRLLNSRPDEICADETRKIIESVTGQPANRYWLLRPTWETDRFRGDRCVMSGWFDGRVCGKEIADALHTVFTKMVRCVLDANAPYARRECKSEMIKALSLYLEIRGFALPEPRPSSPKKRRGRPPMQDAENDKRWFDLWKSGKYKTFKEMALALRMDQDRLEQSIERERKRRERQRRRSEAPDKIIPLSRSNLF